ncbi:MAG: hypothetical protein ACLVJ6_17040 [Merdibacter sp.]
MKRFIAACVMAVLLLTGMSGVSLNASEAYTVENLDITIHVQKTADCWSASHTI